MLHRSHIALFAVLFAFVGCKDEPEEPELIRPVRYIEVEGRDAARQRTYSGVAQAGQESRLSFQVSGQVLSVPVNVGDVVKKDQTIARMDPTDFSLQLQNAQAAAAQSRAQERNAKATYQRTQALYENQNVSKQDLDADRTAYDSARASLNAANQQIRLSKRQLGYTHLQAPEAGTIATVDIEVNEYVRAGALVATLLAGEQIEVSVSVPASVIRNIKRGGQARARFNSLDGKAFDGVVTEVGVASMSGSATFPVTVRLNDAKDEARAGMAADVTFKFDSDPDAPEYTLPAVAIGEDRAGRFVFKLEKTGDGLGVVHRSPVVVGELLSDGLEISSGIETGDLVVTAGVSRIYDGLTVRVPSRAGSEPANVASNPSAPEQGEETAQ